MPRNGLMRVASLLPAGAIIGAAVWPIADLALANRAPLDWLHAAGWFALLSTAFFIATAALSLLRRPAAANAAVVAPLAIVLFSFPLAAPWLRALVRLAGLHHGAGQLFGLLLLILAIVLWRASRSIEVRRLLLLFPLIAAATSSAAAAGTAFVRNAPLHGPVDRPQHFKTRPNVYHFLFDTLGRPDALKRRLDLDASSLPSLLAGRGFVQARDANAARLFTIDSITTLLSPGSVARGLADLDASGSVAVRQFRRNGYAFARYGEVFYFAGCRGDEDLCIASQTPSLSEFDIALLARTPLFPIWRARLLATTTSRNFHANLTRVATTVPRQPFFLFSYMVPPHPPFIFDDDCRPVAKDYNDFRAWRDEARASYGRAYRCVTAALGPAVDAIIARDPGAIIIISGDHGPSFLGGGKEDRTPRTPEALDERQSVFLAVRGPRRCRQSFASITQLDQLYPRLFDCLSGAAT